MLVLPQIGPCLGLVRLGQLKFDRLTLPHPLCQLGGDRDQTWLAPFEALEYERRFVVQVGRPPRQMCRRPTIVELGTGQEHTRRSATNAAAN
jgi:hypothetical protein